MFLSSSFKLFDILDVDTSLLNDFDCGTPKLNEYLQHRALEERKHRISNTKILVYRPSNKVIAFYTLSCDSILLKRTVAKENHKIPHIMYYNVFPAARIGRLGVHKDYQFSRDCNPQLRKIGTRILLCIIGNLEEINSKIGIRFITIHPKKEGKLLDWYSRRGFRLIEELDRSYSMYFDIIHDSHKLVRCIK